MDLLNKLIADPEAIKNIKDMVGNVSESRQNEGEDKIPSSDNYFNSMPFLYEFLNNKQNSEMLNKINKAYSGYSNTKTPGLQLLDALKPYLNQRRVENLERIRKAIKISNAFSEFNK